jgi:hypothetical protein
MKTGETVMRMPIALLATVAVIGALAAAPAGAEQKPNTKPAAGAAKGGPTKPGTKGFTDGGIMHDDNWEKQSRKGGAKGGSK